MAARKKKAKAPARKRTAPAKKRASRRELPNDEAWRELVATAIEKPDASAQTKTAAAESVRAKAPPKNSAPQKKARKSRK